MSSSDPIVDALMAPGAPFEVIARGAVRVFKHAPETMSDFFNRARGFGTAEFIVSGARRLTYDDFFAASDALSAHLIDSGLLPGQSAAICMQNSPDWMIAFVAILNAGGVAVLVNSRGTGETMSRAISDADCTLVIADEKRAQKLQGAGGEIAVLLPADFPAAGGAEFEPVARKSDDLAAMFFTSGTTGVAKAAAIQNEALITGMMNTQMAMAAVFQKMAAAYNIDVETLRAQMPQSCSLLVFPLFHTSGCSSVFMTALVSGGKLVLMDRWDADAALALIAQEKVTTFGGVPAMLWDILNAKTFDQHDLSSLMSVSCGGQALPLNLLAQIRETFPRAFVGAGYGMTETCGAISQANGEAFLANPTASGQVLPMFDLQITSDSGQALPTGEVGEIWVKGATLMQGYYGRPEDTTAAMSGDWFKTGDIGRLDEAGYIYIVDRKTDMVISGGENIYCAEVEQALGRHPDILAITTFGVEDERLGERLVASAQVKDGITANEILRFAQDNLGDYKVPTDILLQTEPFALNAMGKIEKQKARAEYLARKKKEQAA